MRIAGWIPKATNARSEYVTLIVFLRQQWLLERASCYDIALLLIFCTLCHDANRTAAVPKLPAENITSACYVTFNLYCLSPVTTLPRTAQLFLHSSSTNPQSNSHGVNGSLAQWKA